MARQNQHNENQSSPLAVKRPPKARNHPPRVPCYHTHPPALKHTMGEEIGWATPEEIKHAGEEIGWRNSTMAKRNHDPSNAVASKVIRAQPTPKAAPPMGHDLTDDELLFYQQWCECRDQWSLSELHLLAQAAKWQAISSREQRLVRHEDSIAFNGSGGPMPNPRYRIIDQADRIVLQIFRALHLSIQPNHAGAQNRKGRGTPKAMTVIGQDEPIRKKNGDIDWKAEAARG